MLPTDALRELQKERDDLLVLIDTLQTNLRTVSTYLTEEELKEVNTRSYKWCLNWKNGKDE
tara:strand:- start:2526 stop:2708 length:183 start_codon:yes stop_codon:yes gene_type:complete